MHQPLKFHPIYKNILWGGRNLERFGKSLPEGMVAESWEISAHPDGMGVVSEGPHAGEPLSGLLATYGTQLIGTGFPGKDLETFPLFIKLIDANDKLSVQVHPDDDYAFRNENGGSGKNELWYILDCRPGSKLVYGLLPHVTRERFEHAVETGEVEKCLRYVTVQPGDCLDIPSGLVHAIGEGIVLYEVQQNSNITYRVYDYDRVSDGKKRELHVQKALDVIQFSLGKKEFQKGLAIHRPGYIRTFLKANRYFCLEHVLCDGCHRDDTGGRRFHAYTIFRGHGIIGNTRVSMGESILVPAIHGEYHISGDFEALKSYVPDIDMDVVSPLLAEGFQPEEIRRAVL